MEFCKCTQKSYLLPRLLKINIFIQVYKLKKMN